MANPKRITGLNVCESLCRGKDLKIQAANYFLRAAAVAVLAVAVGVGYSQTATGTFTDIRDNKQYRTVTIGGQVWMAENLNYKADSSWCYENDDANCKKYGRLYDWHAALTACPAGWRLPTDEEWDELINAAGGSEIAGGILTFLRRGYYIITSD